MIVVIDVNPWAADKEQKRFHDIKVEHDILRFKINTRINTSKCLFRNIQLWGDHILNYLLTGGSFTNPLTARINLPLYVRLSGFLIKHLCLIYSIRGK